MKHYNKIRFIIICLAVLVSMSAHGGNDLLLRFGVNATDSPTVVGQKFLPVLDRVAQELGRQLNRTVNIKFRVFRTYDAAVKGLIDANVDFARLGPSSYIMAKQQNRNIRLLAMGSRKGKKKFYGFIIVHKDSDIQNLTDLRGRTFAFGNEISTIGRYLAQIELLKAGICAKDLAHFEYVGRHDNVFSSVELKKFDAGALKEFTVHKRNKAKQVRILHKFPNVTKPWVARANLDETIFHAIQSVLLKLRNKSVLKALKSDGFFPTSHKEYEFLEKAMQQANEFTECQH